MGPIAAQVRAAGFSAERGACRGLANGITDFGGRRVVVRQDLQPAQAAKTLVHELAHVLLHEGGNHLELVEVEAESVAFVACRAAGLDTDDYSFAYVDAGPAARQSSFATAHSGSSIAPDRS